MQAPLICPHMYYMNLVLPAHVTFIANECPSVVLDVLPSEEDFLVVTEDCW